jgi:hypothetical protein
MDPARKPPGTVGEDFNLGTIFIDTELVEDGLLGFRQCPARRMDPEPRRPGA